MLPDIFANGNSNFFTFYLPYMNLFPGIKLSSFVKNVVGGEEDLILKANQGAIFNDSSTIIEGFLFSFTLPWEAHYNDEAF